MRAKGVSFKGAAAKLVLPAPVSGGFSKPGRNWGGDWGAGKTTFYSTVCTAHFVYGERKSMRDAHCLKTICLKRSTSSTHAVGSRALL